MNSKIRNTILLITVLLGQSLFAGTGGTLDPKAIIPCTNGVKNGKIVLNKVNRMTYLMESNYDIIEVEGTSGNVFGTDTGGSLRVRFRTLKQSCVGCTTLEQRRENFSRSCEDAARAAMGLVKSLVFQETVDGAFCVIADGGTPGIDLGGTTIKPFTYEVRDTAGNIPLPPAFCSVE